MNNSNTIQMPVLGAQPRVFTEKDIIKAIPECFDVGGELFGYYRLGYKGQVIIDWRSSKWKDGDIVMLKTFDGVSIRTGLEFPVKVIGEDDLLRFSSALTVQDIIDAEATKSHDAAARLLVEKACQFYGKGAELALRLALGMEPFKCFKMVMKQRRVATKKGVAA